MKNGKILYGAIGLVAGAVFMGVFLISAAGNDQQHMMGMHARQAAGNDIDRHFIEQMVPHHDSAIAMAKSAQQKASHSEIRTLANNIIDSQTDENSKMRRWYTDWYGTAVPRRSWTGMMGGMMDSQTEVARLNAAPDFDKAFLEQMIPHHQMAVMMANMLEGRTDRTEMKLLAADIESAQTKEIKEMQQWQKDWGYVL